MSRNDLVNKNWLANSFRNLCKRNYSPENFVIQSLANITKKILDLEREKAKKGPENPAKLKAQK